LQQSPLLRIVDDNDNNREFLTQLLDGNMPINAEPRAVARPASRSVSAGPAAPWSKMDSPKSRRRESAGCCEIGPDKMVVKIDHDSIFEQCIDACKVAHLAPPRWGLSSRNRRA
jgi:hypothetical protein